VRFGFHHRIRSITIHHSSSIALLVDDIYWWQAHFVVFSPILTTELDILRLANPKISTQLSNGLIVPKPA
jgi:hypothetical protein